MKNKGKTMKKAKKTQQKAVSIEGMPVTAYPASKVQCEGSSKEAGELVIFCKRP